MTSSAVPYRPLLGRLSAGVLLLSLVLGGVLAPQAHILWMQVDGQMSMDMHHAEEFAHTEGLSWSASVDCADECPILALISGQSQASGVESIDITAPNAKRTAFTDADRTGHSRTDVSVKVRGPPRG